MSTSQLNIRGITEKVYVLTFAGPALGKFKGNQGAYSLGTETDSVQFDSTYGIWVGGTYNASAKWTGTGTTENDTYFEQESLKDTSLAFNVTSTSLTSIVATNTTSSTPSTSGGSPTAIPGFPIESILLGVVLALTILAVRRSRKPAHARDNATLGSDGTGPEINLAEASA